MLFRRAILERIVAGEIDLAFRRWDRPRVRVGSQLRTVVGVLEVVAVDRVAPSSVSLRDARRSGWKTVADVREAGKGEGPLWRVELRYLGEDPRVALRSCVPSAAEVADVIAVLEGIDGRSSRGPWTRDVLALIARRPETLAAELASEMGLETVVFKRDVRRLKELGLTESLKVGYRLSPRGEAVMRGWGA